MGVGSNFLSGGHPKHKHETTATGWEWRTYYVRTFSWDLLKSDRTVWSWLDGAVKPLDQSLPLSRGTRPEIE